MRGADIKPLNKWYQVHRKAENHVGPVDGDCRDFKVCRAICKRGQRGVPTCRGHGWHGLHREQQGLVHAQRAHQHTHAIGGHKKHGVAGFFYASSSLRIQRPTNSSILVSNGSEGGGCVPRPYLKTAMAGKSCSANVCAATSREDFGMRHESGALPQRLWATRHLGGRPGKGASRNLPQGHCCQDFGAARNGDLGRWPSDPYHSCSSMTASRAST